MNSWRRRNNNTNKMKKLFVICIMAALSIGALAQNEGPKGPKGPGNMNEKFQAEKVAFLTQKMDLTVEEAQVFWPVYNEYSKASEQAHKEMMAAVGKVHKCAELTDAETEAAINELLAAQKKENDLMAQYTEQFKKVLPVKKVAAFFAAEDAFRKHLFRRFKAGDGPQGPQMPKGQKGPKVPKGPKDPKEPTDKIQK